MWYAPSGRMYVEEPVIVEKEVAQGNTNDTGDVWVLKRIFWGLFQNTQVRRVMYIIT